MKPKKLIFKGINSFLNEESIDFLELSKYNIFAIIGNTGSGKTTIIDTIILALYGKVPRYGKSFPYGKIFNRNTSKKTAYVRFYFSIFIKGKDQDFLIERVFSENKEGNIVNNKAYIYEINNEEKKILNEKKSDIDNIILDLIGLNYEDFTTSVILPQGEFDKFLKLSNVDKSKSLERLFNLKIYGTKLKTLTNEKYNVLKNKLENVNSKINLDVYKDVNIESINGLNKDLDGQKTLSTTLKRDIVTKNDTLKKQEKQIEEIGLYDKYNTQLSTLLLNEESINTKKYIIKNYENAVFINDNIQQLNNSKEMLKVMEIEFSQIKLLKKDRDNKFITKENEKKEIDDFRRNDYSLLIENIEKHKALSEKYNDFLIQSKELEKLENALHSLQKNLKEKDENLDLFKTKNEVLSNKYNIYLQLQDENRLTADYISKCAMLANRETNLKNMTDNINAISTDKNNLILDIEKNKNKFKTNEDNLKIEKNKIIELESKRESYLLEKSINHILKNMKNDDNCLVCNNKIDDIVKIKSSHKDTMEIISTLDAHIEKVKSNIEKLNNIIISLEMKMQNQEDNLKNTEESYLKLQKEIQELKNSLFLEYKNYEVKSFIDELKINYKKGEIYEDTQIQLQDIKLKSDLNQQQIITLESEINIIKTKISNTKILLEEKTKNINGIKISDPKDTLKKLINEKEIFLENEKKVLEDFDNLKDELKETDKNYRDIENKVIILNKEVGNLTISQDELLRKYNLSLEDITNVLAHEKNIKEYEINIEEFHNSKNFLTLKIEELNISLKSVDRESIFSNYNVLINELKEMENYLEKTLSNIGSIEKNLSEKKSKLIELNSLKDEKEIIENEFRSLEEIKSLFSSHNFINFLCERHLKYVIKDATKRLLNITRGRYSLLVDGVDYYIVDHFDSNTIRDIQTLSGGETFVVSLSLSLALSNRIKLKNNGSIDMFFLDEGFGSLDSISLEYALNSLYQIKNDKMILGIITHVEKVKEEIPRKLIVYREENTNISSTYIE